jgi:hypothetical protein
MAASRDRYGPSLALHLTIRHANRRYWIPLNGHAISQLLGYP